MSLMMGPLVGCASLGSPNGGEGGAGGAGPSQTKIVTVACANSRTDVASLLDWELTVSPTPIMGGESFGADVHGFVVFNESFLDEAQPLVPGGVREANLVDLNATVHVRSGTTGDDDVVLKPEPIPYKCDEDRAVVCNPGNDLPGTPGRRGNTDCKPEGDFNPCGRFVLMPTSTDCAPGGVCDDRGKAGPESQCELNAFCVTGDLEIELEKDFGVYTADSQGNVLFGWAEGESTGATLQEGGNNPGTWNFSPVVYEDPTGPIGVRVGIGPELVALECTMGVGSGISPFTRRTPDAALISFPIQTQ